MSLLVFAKKANAQDPDVFLSRGGYGAEIITGTYGTGLAFSVRKSYYYSLRLLTAAYDNRTTMKEVNNDNAYEYYYDSEFTNHALIANIYLFGGGIFVSSGFFNVNMEYNAQGYATRAFTENGDDYLLQADYTSSIRYKGNVPYMGIGIGARRHSKSRITLRAEMGIILMPEADDVRLNFGTIQAVGGASLDSAESRAAQAELRDKAEGAYLAKIKRDAEAFEFYPVFEAGIIYNF
ncbi:MAG: hypothetical protein K0U45_04000 [Alphaproteobacteria bacterium]|nr:hypothetical protein [Alphaproteobacteria bacterium]